MRFILRATRAIIAAATATHIAALKGQVKLSDRRYYKAIARTDAARVAANMAAAVAAEARTTRNELIRAEQDERRSNLTLRAAADAEAGQLRRGFTFA